MQLDPRDTAFIAEKLPTVEGWLLDDAAYLTSALLRLQTQQGVSGSIFEIGVFAGKYLSLLYHLSADTRDRVLGLDTFEWYPKAKVETTFTNLFGNTGRILISGAIQNVDVFGGDFSAAAAVKIPALASDQGERDLNTLAILKE